MNDNEKKGWSFAIDRGGTFTDIIGFDPEGELHSLKILSKSNKYSDPSIEGIRRIMDLSPDEIIPESDVTRIRMGTTVATNAILEKKGAPTCLAITEGFGDLLAIGNQARPDLFTLAIKKPLQIYDAVIEVKERINYQGKIIIPFNETSTKNQLELIRDKNISSLAIVLMHAWKNKEHELRIAEIARSIGFNHVAISHEIMPIIKILGRGQTTLIDAYLSPILLDYISALKKETGGIPLEFMQSSGGLTNAESFRGKDAVMSGPSGGVIATAKISTLNGMTEAIGFDMGGTSTDVSRFAGDYEKVEEATLGGISFQTPSLKINTVAAGGGSILWFDGEKMRVGPESAGANPGPICYGLEGQLALTDANLFLRRILPKYFPKTFGPHNDQFLNEQKTHDRFHEITEEINTSLGTSMSEEEVALGFIRIANETMAAAIKEISVNKGFDIRTHVLVSFGGAAAQHACGIAKILNIKKILIHPMTGLFSAYGIAISDQTSYAIHTVLNPFIEKNIGDFESQLKRMGTKLENKLKKRGFNKSKIQTKKFLDLRYSNTDKYLTIPFTSFKLMENDFRKLHRKFFGFFGEGNIEVVNLRMEVIGRDDHYKEKEKASNFQKPVIPTSAINVRFEEKSIDCPIYNLSDLIPGSLISGPGIIIDEFSTIIIEPEFQAEINSYGHVIITQTSNKQLYVGTKKDPVMLEVFNNLFMNIAEQMGHTLTRTAHSVNIKERLDFSCAIFDPMANLVANAPHMPVHLGAMGESVKTIIDENNQRMKPGDVFLMNNPHRGGSHLPDLTVISPVFSNGQAPIFFVASRGHHSDIGGITPGSMPPFGTSIQDEGVIINNFKLVSEGKFRSFELIELLSSGDFPARNIPERIADAKAQVAAVQKGIVETEKLIKKYGLKTVHAYMNYIRSNASKAVRRALFKYLDGKEKIELSFEDFLDSGESILVKIIIESGDKPPDSCRAIVDFTGTSSQLEGNLNAPLAVTKAAVLYVFRLMIDEDIPLNSGCLDPIQIIVPKGCLLRPDHLAAVVGGNVETSQRITDVLLGALGLSGASQGTMNNFLFGKIDGSGKQYYETIAGGSGASDGNHGESAVQVHMTNTRATDPEILEFRYPEIRLERFSIRKGSGGSGKFKGGNGTIREIRFLKKRKVSILSERRKYQPYGMAGGGFGKAGKNSLIKASGKKVLLKGKVEKIVKSGDRIIIETPGGGGYGVK